MNERAENLAGQLAVETGVDALLKESSSLPALMKGARWRVRAKDLLNIRKEGRICRTSES
jgi:hypothetical protein